jgi:PAS domain-containing protein
LNHLLFIQSHHGWINDDRKIGSRAQTYAAFSADQERLLTTFSIQASAAAQRLTTILSDQQQHLESLFEHMPVGVLLLDSDFFILASNPLGRKLAQLLNPQAVQGLQTLDHLGEYPTQELIAQLDSPLPVEITLEDHPDRIFAVQIRQAGAPARSGKTQWVITLNEITQERENQARIQVQARLATVGQLAAESPTTSTT